MNSWKVSFFLFVHSEMVKRFNFLNLTYHKLIVCRQFQCQIVLFDPYVGPYQVLPLRSRVNLGAMTMKGYSTFPKAERLKTHHQIVQCQIQDTLWGSLTPLQRYSRYILHVCTINKSAHTKIKVWKLIVCTSYLSVKFRSMDIFLWLKAVSFFQEVDYIIGIFCFK